MSYFSRINLWCILYLIVAKIQYSCNQRHNINSEYYSDKGIKSYDSNDHTDGKSYGLDLSGINNQQTLNHWRNVRDISDYVDDQLEKDSPNANDAELHLFSWWKGMSDSNKNKKKGSSTTDKSGSSTNVPEAIGSAPPSLKVVANPATPPLNRQMADNSSMASNVATTPGVTSSLVTDSVNPSNVSGTPTDATAGSSTYLTACYTITDTCAPIMTLVAAPICSQENAAISAASTPAQTSLSTTPSLSSTETSTAKTGVTGAVRDATFVITLVLNSSVSSPPLKVPDKDFHNVSQPLSSGILLPVYNISQVTNSQDSTTNKPTEAAIDKLSNTPSLNNQTMENILSNDIEIIDKQIGHSVAPQIIETTQLIVTLNTHNTDEFLIQKLTSNNKSVMKPFKNIDSGNINKLNLSSNIKQVALEEMPIFNNGITNTIFSNELFQTRKELIEHTTGHESLSSIGNLEENGNPHKTIETSDLQNQHLIKKNDNLPMPLYLENSSPLPTISHERKNNDPSNKSFENSLIQANISNSGIIDSKGSNKTKNEKVLQLPENITFSFLIEDLFPFTLSFMNSSSISPPVIQNKTIVDVPLNTEYLTTQNNSIQTISPSNNDIHFEKLNIEQANKSQNQPVIDFPPQTESSHPLKYSNSHIKMNNSSTREINSENMIGYQTTMPQNEHENNLIVKSNNTEISSIGETASTINRTFESTSALPELYQSNQDKVSSNKTLSLENVEIIASSMSNSVELGTNSPETCTEDNKLDQSSNVSNEGSKSEILDNLQDIHFNVKNRINSNLGDDVYRQQVNKRINFSNFKLTESPTDQTNLGDNLNYENNVNEQENYLKNNNSNISIIQGLFKSQQESAYETKSRFPRDSSNQLQSVSITPDRNNTSVFTIDKNKPTKTYFKYSDNVLAANSKRGQNLIEMCKNVTCQGDNILAPCCGAICAPGMCKGEDLSYLLPIPGQPTTTTLKPGNPPNKKLSHHDYNVFVRVPRDSTLNDLVKFQLMHGLSAPDSKGLMNALKEANYQAQKINKEFHPDSSLYPNQAFANNLRMVDTNRILENLKYTLADSMIHKQLGTDINEKEDKYRTIRNQSPNDEDEYFQESNPVLETLKIKAEEEARRILELQLKRKQEEDAFYKERESNLQELRAIQEMKQRESEASRLYEDPNNSMFQTNNLSDNPYTKLVQQIGKSGIGNDEVFDRYSEMNNNISNYVLPQTNPIDISLSDKPFPALDISKNAKDISFPILKLQDENSNYLPNKRNKRTALAMNDKSSINSLNTFKETFDSFHNNLFDLQKYIASNVIQEQGKTNIDKSELNFKNINISSILEKAH